MLSQVADFPAMELPIEGVLSPRQKNVLRVIGGLILLFGGDSARVILLKNKMVTPAPAYCPKYMTTDIPGADTPIDELMDLLATEEDVQDFLQKHGKGSTPQNPKQFVESYRLTPAQFQENGWEGPCNNFAEFWCDWGERHGKKMYLVALWPKDKEGNTFKDRHSWHLIGAFSQVNRDGEKEIYVCDNNSIHKVPRLEEYAEVLGMEILPMGGVTRWQREAPGTDIRAQFWGQMAFNAQDMEPSPLTEKPRPFDLKELVASLLPTK